jgi:hypothetical protein
MIHTYKLRVLLIALTATAFVAGSVEIAPAGSSEGGRVGNPKRLRAQREPRPKGRKMSRPSIPEPEQRIPLRSRALIPNPEPNTRGGSGFQRKGKYFYETPKDIELTRTKPGSGYRLSVPRPEQLGTQRRAKDGRRR